MPGRPTTVGDRYVVAPSNALAADPSWGYPRSTSGTESAGRRIDDPDRGIARPGLGAPQPPAQQPDPDVGGVLGAIGPAPPTTGLAERQDREGPGGEIGEGVAGVEHGAEASGPVARPVSPRFRDSVQVPARPPFLNPKSRSAHTPFIRGDSGSLRGSALLPASPLAGATRTCRGSCRKALRRH